MLNDDVGVFMCACLNKKCSGRFGGVEAFSRLYFAAFRCVFSHIFLVFAQRWTQKRNSESSFFLLLMSFSLLTFCVPLPPIISMSMKTTYIYISIYIHEQSVYWRWCAWVCNRFIGKMGGNLHSNESLAVNFAMVVRRVRCKNNISLGLFFEFISMANVCVLRLMWWIQQLKRFAVRCAVYI